MFLRPVGRSWGLKEFSRHCAPHPTKIRFKIGVPVVHMCEESAKNREQTALRVSARQASHGSMKILEIACGARRPAALKGRLHSIAGGTPKSQWSNAAPRNRERENSQSRGRSSIIRAGPSVSLQKALHRPPLSPAPAP
ncbi:hypothetical protein NDU88_007181 [Pleurodeles waltl]|uniref:Uncharacterized protein n=1 Tax=Pleurodeles waltl TaxID=8319 RepID=A0AAV7NSC3_PLEWA|nr:hypothetical protein NDU88_007181 [Pleurodeles waltl]